MVQCKTIHF